MHAALERPDIRQYLTACHELFEFLLALQGASTYVGVALGAITVAVSLLAGLLGPLAIVVAAVMVPHFSPGSGGIQILFL